MWGDPLSRHGSRLHGTCSSRGVMAGHACWWVNSRASSGLPRKERKLRFREMKKKMEFWEGGELWTGRGVSLGEKGEKQSKLLGVFLRSKLEEFPSRRWCLCCHAEESLRIPRYVLFSIDWFGHQRLLICFAKVVCVYMLCLFFLWIPGLSLQIFDAWLHSWTWYG